MQDVAGVEEYMELETTGDTVALDHQLRHRRSRVTFHHSDTNPRLLHCSAEEEALDEGRMDASERPASYDILKSRQHVRDVSGGESNDMTTLMDAEHCIQENLGRGGVLKGPVQGKGASYASSLDVVKLPSTVAPALVDANGLLRYGPTNFYSSILTWSFSLYVASGLMRGPMRPRHVCGFSFTAEHVVIHTRRR